MAKSQKSPEINVIQISQGCARLGVVGTRPLIMNSMSAKTKRTLLLPSGRKTSAEKAINLKHDPIAEFRDSVYRVSTGPTLLALPASAFKGAMANAALDLPGTRKAEVARLLWVEDTMVPVFGTPQLLMSVVRSADIDKTPDVRTRAILPRWASIITVSFVTPKLTPIAVGNLLAAAGVLAGVGDFRQERGKGSFGQFRMADENDSELAEIIETGGREAQKKALANPVCYDADTEELLSWYQQEIIRRGRGDMVTPAGDEETEEEEAAE